MRSLGETCSNADHSSSFVTQRQQLQCFCSSTIALFAYLERSNQIAACCVSMLNALHCMLLSAFHLYLATSLSGQLSLHKDHRCSTALLFLHTKEEQRNKLTTPISNCKVLVSEQCLKRIFRVQLAELIGRHRTHHRASWLVGTTCLQSPLTWPTFSPAEGAGSHLFRSWILCSNFSTELTSTPSSKRFPFCGRRSVMNRHLSHPSVARIVPLPPASDN